jgi:hypothetical protein
VTLCLTRPSAGSARGEVPLPGYSDNAASSGELRASHEDGTGSPRCWGVAAGVSELTDLAADSGVRAAGRRRSLRTGVGSARPDGRFARPRLTAGGHGPHLGAGVSGRSPARRRSVPLDGRQIHCRTHSQHRQPPRAVLSGATAAERRSALDGLGPASPSPALAWYPRRRMAGPHTRR